MSGPQAALLPDGRRLHLNHGPIDLVIEAFGLPDEVQAAYRQATDRFQSVLEELVAELADLRRPVSDQPNPFAGSIARRMFSAVIPYAEQYITPMAAVAGSVAEEVLEALLRDRRLARAYVNNGGDIALVLGAGQAMTLAIAGTTGRLADRICIGASDPVRGVATSGWRGRSFSRGIADAVTVLARTAAQADAAATIIANAADLPGHPAISRKPANEMAPDTDLGAIPVTVNVGILSPGEVAAALDAGLAMAGQLMSRGLIEGAALFLADGVRSTDRMAGHITQELMHA